MSGTCLGYCAGEAVKDEADAALWVRDVVLDETHHQVVRDETTCVHRLLRLHDRKPYVRLITGLASRSAIAEICIGDFPFRLNGEFLSVESSPSLYTPRLSQSR